MDYRVPFFFQKLVPAFVDLDDGELEWTLPSNSMISFNSGQTEIREERSYGMLAAKFENQLAVAKQPPRVRLCFRLRFPKLMRIRNTVLPTLTLSTLRSLPLFP